MELNNVFLTPQMGEERCMRFVTATEVSHSSYSKRYEFSLGSLVGILVGRPEGRRPLGRPRHRWEDSKDGSSGNSFWGCGLDSFGSG
jgi:hypothetical protein